MGPRRAQAEPCPGAGSAPFISIPGVQQERKRGTHTLTYGEALRVQNTHRCTLKKKKKEDTPDCWVQNQLEFTEASIEPWVLQLGRGLLGEDQAPARLWDLE